ncbi:MAG: hypothetical protein IKS51_00545 [Erysipelotrichaceae bacterium]|nr:hypothetical protein [Erysipelotrichaceae bacterium]
MSKNDNVLTVRLSPDMLLKLDELIGFYEEEADRIGMRPPGKKEIVEDAIRDLYYKKINETRDGDVVDRINSIVEDRVNVSMNNLHRKIDELLYLTIKNDYGNKLIYRSPSIIPPPPKISDAIEIIVDERSGWNDALDEFMLKRMKKRKKEE